MLEYGSPERRGELSFDQDTLRRLIAKYGPVYLVQKAPRIPKKGEIYLAADNHATLLEMEQDPHSESHVRYIFSTRPPSESFELPEDIL